MKTKFSSHARPAEHPALSAQERFRNWLLSMDRSYRLGLVLYAASLGWFGVSSFLAITSTNEFGIFSLNYVIAISYTVYLLIIGKMKPLWRRQPAESIDHRLLCWWIWIVGCFALNRSIAVFQESALWLCIALAISGALSIMHTGLAFLPSRFRDIFYFLWGSSLCLWVYFTGYLLWLYPVSVLALLFFGLSFHTFVPLFLLIAHLKVFIRGSKVSGQGLMITSIASPLILVGTLLTQWVMTTHRLNEAYTLLELNTSDELPTWVKLAQKTDKSWLTERILKGDLVYQVPGKQFDFGPSLRNFEEIHRHDPIVLLGSFLAKTTPAKEERIKIIETLHDARHHTQERLWTGRNLHTSEVVTNVKIYPSYRLAYTEKTLSIQNTAPNTWQREEAIYTFFVPEGSVVTSLSLWINGKEEKGYLTTQSKAQSAYTTIVGVENRDPSVVHWQEGNTVSVRVFPCTTHENRRFKIGITSPLLLKDNELMYENIYFKGPDNTRASEVIRVKFTEKVDKLQSTLPIAQGNLMEYTGSYTPDWSVRFISGSLASQKFVFQHKSYQLENYIPSYEPFHPAAVYLDVNETWRWSEFETICQHFNYKNLWVYDDRLVSVSTENAEKIFKKLAQNRFSLFPIYRISNPKEALIITKGVEQSPLLKEIKKSVFAQNMNHMASKMSPVRTFCLNNTLSPFFKTLHELRLLSVSYGSINDLQRLLQKQQFRAVFENKDSAIALIEPAQMMIREVTSKPTDQSNAPDHLLRLYAYNHILQQIGARYFEKEELADTLVSEAATAHIVTPVSSLIVLETQEDYRRFDIKKSINSLENATLKKSGAVPEPHEWALMILLVGLIVYAWIRPNGNLF